MTVSSRIRRLYRLIWNNFVCSFTAQSTLFRSYQVGQFTQPPFLGRLIHKLLTSTCSALSTETDNCLSSNRRERTTVENISWSISTKECCRSQQVSNPPPPDHQSDAHRTATRASLLKQLFGRWYEPNFCITRSHLIHLYICWSVSLSNVKIQVMFFCFFNN